MTYGGLVSYGDYTFENLRKFSSNFADQQTQVLPLPGVDGGFDIFGDDPAPAPVGKVAMDFMVATEDRAEMTALRDAVKEMQSYGLAKLIEQPTDSADDQRWTWARLKSVKMSEDKGEHTDLFQKVSLTFECPNPVWYVERSTHWSLDGTYTLGELESGGFTVGDTSEDNSLVGSSNTITITNNGNTKAIPKIIIYDDRGQSCKNVTIQRLSSSAVVEEIKYNGTLTDGDIIVANGRTHEFILNAEPAFDNLDYSHPNFIQLLPGDNSIRVLLEDSGASAPAVTYDESVQQLEGTITNVTISNSMATFSGGTYPGNPTYIDILSTYLSDNFDGAEFSVITRQRVSLSAIWDDSNNRYVVRINGGGDIILYKYIANTFRYWYNPGTLFSIEKGSITTADWFTAGMSVSYTGDAMKAFWDGVQEGSTQTGLVEWVSSSLNLSYLGTLGGVGGFWDGDISDVILTLNSIVLSDTDHATLNSALSAGTLTGTQLDTICGVGNWVWWAFNESTQAVKVSFSLKDNYR